MFRPDPDPIKCRNRIWILSRQYFENRIRIRACIHVPVAVDKKLTGGVVGQIQVGRSSHHHYVQARVPKVKRQRLLSCDVHTNGMTTLLGAHDNLHSRPQI